MLFVVVKIVTIMILYCYVSWGELYVAYVFSVSRSSLAMLDRFPRAFSNCVKGGEREKREKEGERKRKRERERKRKRERERVSRSPVYIYMNTYTRNESIFNLQ